MKIVFCSNYFNHHQKPFSDAMRSIIGDGYTFVETEELSEERKRLGWGIKEYPSYVVSCDRFRRDPDFVSKIIDEADAVIIGSAPNDLITNRIRNGKLVLRYSERPLKKGLELWKYPVRWLRLHRNNPRNANVYMLCASAYTASDYAKFGLFRNRCYTWGYFPEVKKYDDVEALILAKKQASLLWCGRMIDWKHPEAPIEIAKRLKADGYNFTMNLIGTGVMEETLRSMIEGAALTDCVQLLGSMAPEQVRTHMEESEIFLFTSDRNEGWGAVLNESMNSACAVVASKAIGSAPFLVDDGKNGLIYRDGNLDDLYDRVKWLLDHPTERKTIAQCAYDTMKNDWSAETAARRLVALCQSLLNDTDGELFENGVCRKILKDS